MEKVLESFQSAFQRIHVTEDGGGFRTLRFGEDGASQSVVKPGDPRHLQLAYSRVLPAGLAFVDDPRRLLIIGLGGAALPRFFHSHFPEMTIDVVELDPQVLEVARRHFGLVEDERLRVSIADGRDFIEAIEQPYDLIVLDCFDAETIPAHLTTREFLQAARNGLTSTGAVVANIWGPAGNPLYAAMLATYRSVFPDVYVLDVPGPDSKLFVALTVKCPMSRQLLLEKCGVLTARRNFTYKLEAAVAGFRNAALETTRPAAVLTD